MSLTEKELRLKVRSLDEEIEKRVNAELERIKAIKYFKPERSLDEANSLIPKVEEIINNYMHALKPWKKGRTWNAAENVARATARDVARDVVRTTAWDVASDAAWDVARGVAWNEASYALRDALRDVARGKTWNEAYNATRDAAWDAARYAAWDVAWTVVSDLPGFENNPFNYVIQLYEMGLKPTNFRRVDGQERYVVDFPLKIDGKSLLGCYAHGDKEILWTHEWKDYCKNLKAIKPKIRIVEY